MTRRAGSGVLAVWAAFLLAVPLAQAQPVYVFPVAVDPGWLVWDEQHWDGSHAVDIGIHPAFKIDATERAQFYASDVLAVVAGRAMRLDNPRGGIAVLLHGADGRTYYYAHLSGSTIDKPREVAAGEALGRIGRTGTWTQYLEPHLHLAIAQGHQSGTGWEPDVSAALWLESAFGMAPTRADRQPYQTGRPSGYPLFGKLAIVTTFAEARARNPQLAGTTLASPGAGSSASPDVAVPVRAPMTGRLRVHLDTPLGVRVQITNARSEHSVIISGAINPMLHTGVVHSNDVLGFATGPVHYMVFAGGVAVDPSGL